MDGCAPACVKAAITQLSARVASGVGGSTRLAPMS